MKSRCGILSRLSRKDLKAFHFRLKSGPGNPQSLAPTTTMRAFTGIFVSLNLVTPLPVLPASDSFLATMERAYTLAARHSWCSFWIHFGNLMHVISKRTFFLSPKDHVWLPDGSLVCSESRSSCWRSFSRISSSPMLQPANYFFPSQHVLYSNNTYTYLYHLIAAIIALSYILRSFCILHCSCLSR